MGESRREQIRRLEGEVAYYRGQDETLGPYVKIGRELQARVMERVHGMSVQDLERALIEEVAGSEERLVRDGIWARIAQLPSRTVLEWYAKAVGDEEVNGLLSERAEIEKEFLRNNMHVERMRQWGATYQNIDTSMTHLNDRMVVGLTWFISQKGQLKDTIALRRLGHEDTGGLFEVLTPPNLDALYGGLSVSPHGVLMIGGARIPKTETLDPVLSLGSPLSAWRFEFGTDGERLHEPRRSRGNIGFIAVNDIVVLGERPEAA